jgi:folate-binding protein YgfZ
LLLMENGILLLLHTICEVELGAFLYGGKSSGGPICPMRISPRCGKLITKAVSTVGTNREQARFCLLDDRALIRVIGDDRIAFFHGITSNDIQGATPASILPALFLSEHAHVIGELFVWFDKDALILDVSSQAWPIERAHIEKLLVADDVELEELPDRSMVYLESPKASEILGAPPIEPGRFARAEGLLIGRIARYGADAYSLIGDRDAIAEVLRKLETAGAHRIDAGDLELTRIENGIAKVGVDTGERTIALEARLNRAISLNKGCYLGQETIERATSRGGLKKKMYGLRFHRPINPGARLMLDGREVGIVTSAAVSPKFGAIGLSILHHSAWNPGLTVNVIDGDIQDTATVSEIPFAQE